MEPLGILTSPIPEKQDGIEYHFICCGYLGNYLSLDHQLSVEGCYAATLVGIVIDARSLTSNGRSNSSCSPTIVNARGLCYCQKYFKTRLDLPKFKIYFTKAFGVMVRPYSFKMENHLLSIFICQTNPS